MKRPPAGLAVATAIAAAAVAAFGSWYAAKWQAEKQAAITFSFGREQFAARLEEYPKLLRKILPLSTLNADGLTPEKAQLIATDLNQWLYDRGGVVAHPNTSSAVFQLREVCAQWKSGPRPEDINVLKDAVIHSCRNDLGLISRQDFEIWQLDKLVKERNEKIRQLQQAAGLLEQ